MNISTKDRGKDIFTHTEVESISSGPSLKEMMKEILEG